MLKQLFHTARKLFDRVNAHDCPGLAAEMAYHLLMFSAPGLILVLTLFGFFGHQQDIIDQILLYAGQLLPRDALVVLDDLIRTVTAGSSGGLAIVSLLGSLWAALNGGILIIKALRRAYDIDESCDTTRKLSFWHKEYLALVIVFSFGVAMLFGSNLLIFGNLILDYFTHWWGAPVSLVVHLVHWFIIGSFMVMATAYIYRIVPGYPHVKIAWRHAFTGAVFFVLLWLVLSILFGLYVKNFGNYNEVYGTLGALIVLMLWLYLASLAFLTGGELNALSEE